ncbi:MAG: DUF1329 domain-containing protein [Deltaproteobacteria bacterium]|nr:DUF1329 domain-containing protein [Deltaproteobacteria bacterium]
MRVSAKAVLTGTLCAVLVGSGAAVAAVSAQEAEQLKTALTPLGGEKAGNKEGTIPAWDGGYTTPIPGFKNGGRRPDPFASEKPLFSITAKNMDQYADKLTDGVKAMLKKHPNTYRLDVYPTRRTGVAPQWVYDNTLKNATRAKIIEGAAGPQPQGAYGGIPFPIPKSGVELVWNHLLRWRGESWHFDMHAILVTADGKRVLTSDVQAELRAPYYYRDVSPEKWDGEYWAIRMTNAGPPVRAGEALLVRRNVDDSKTQGWVYLTGQRRVRKLPNPCCDTPTPASAGVMGFDDIYVWDGGGIDRFDWKLVGKKEMFIPYNTNRTYVPKRDSDVIGEHHVNPDHLRWELHRVWVVQATLAKGKRHQAPKGTYYFDEDSWIAVLADRWDAGGRLWKTLWSLPIAAPDHPAVTSESFGFYDLVSNAWFANVVMNEKAEQLKTTPRWPDRVFTPEAMAGEGVR